MTKYAERANMKLGLISSAWLGSRVGTAEGIRKTREIGFDCIDIFADPLEIDIRERRLIKDTCLENGLPVISLPCVALGLGDFNYAVRRFHVDRAKRYLEFCYELEAKNLLLVLGDYIWQQEVIPPHDQWNWATESVRELGEFASALKLEIAIELEPFHYSLIKDLVEMERFLDDVGLPAVQANIDISHLALTSTPADQVKNLRDRIAHVHISDCDGKKHGDLPPGRGVVEFIPYLEAIRDTGFDGAVSIELEYSPDPDRIVEWVQEAYRETDSLLRRLHLRGPVKGSPAAAKI
jgi:D-psicose/D-tagatose/L-ribulose 3-epimerase